MQLFATTPVIRSLWLIVGCMLVFIIVYLSLAPVATHAAATYGDKPGHVLAYAILMAWFANLHAEPSSRFRFALGFVAIGIFLEFVQHWTGYRTFDVADMAANAMGVAAGWLCAPPRIPSCLQGVSKLFRV